MSHNKRIYHPDDPSKWTHLPKEEQERLRIEADGAHEIKDVVMAILVEAHPECISATEVSHQLQRRDHQGRNKGMVRKALFFLLNDGGALTKRKKSTRMWWAGPRALREANGIPHNLIKSRSAP